MGDRRRSKARPPDTSDEAPAVEEELSFEAALERLENVVERLESGELELEGALEAFENGVALARRCAGRLDDAEQRIEVLVREGQQWMARPFEDSGEAGAAEADSRGGPRAASPREASPRERRAKETN